MPLCSIILLFILILLVIVYYRSRIEGFKCISHINVGGAFLSRNSLLYQAYPLPSIPNTLRTSLYFSLNDGSNRS